MHACEILVFTVVIPVFASLLAVRHLVKARYKPESWVNEAQLK